MKRSQFMEAEDITPRPTEEKIVTEDIEEQTGVEFYTGQSQVEDGYISQSITEFPAVSEDVRDSFYSDAIEINPRPRPADILRASLSEVSVTLAIRRDNETEAEFVERCIRRILESQQIESPEIRTILYETCARLSTHSRPVSIFEPSGRDTF